MDIIKFGTALGVWIQEELQTLVYKNFGDDTSTYWSHICTTGVPYQSGILKATNIYHALCYLHCITSYTLAGRRTTPRNITTLDATILSHIYRGISIDMARVIARVVRNFPIDYRKQSLGIGPFITRVANYLEIDLVRADLTEVSTSTIPANLTVLRNMGMVDRDQEGRYTLKQQEWHQQSQQPPPLAPSTFVPRSAFERHILEVG